MIAALIQMFPHRVCLLDNHWLIGADVIGDSLIAFSYVTIAYALLYIGRRPERLARLLVFVASQGARIIRLLLIQFGLFIIACGITHVMDVWTVWQPVYYVDAIVTAMTAVLSARTAVAIVRLLVMFHATEQRGLA